MTFFLSPFFLLHCLPYLSIFQWHNTGILVGADNIVILRDLVQRFHAEHSVTVAGRLRKVLPRLVGLAVIGGTFQDPLSGAGRVGRLDDDVGHMVELKSQNEEYQDI